MTLLKSFRCSRCCPAAPHRLLRSRPQKQIYSHYASILADASITMPMTSA